MLSSETMAYSQQLAPVILAVDALYTAETVEPEGLVVQELKTAENCQPAPFKEYAQAREALVILQGGAAGLPEPDRRVCYDHRFYICTCTRGIDMVLLVGRDSSGAGLGKDSHGLSSRIPAFYVRSRAFERQFLDLWFDPDHSHSPGHAGRRR